MTKQTINIGTSPNDGHGDALRPSFTKVNENFTEVYTTSQSAFNKANTGIDLAQSSFDKANSVISPSSNTLINGAHTVGLDDAGDLILATDGGIVFDRANTSIRVGMGFHIASGEGVSLEAIDENNNFSANNWYFSPTGEMTLPSGWNIGGDDASKGITMTTDRGKLLFGNHPEIIGGPTHFHVMKNDTGTTSGDVDLYFGDDYNYVLQRGRTNGGYPGWGVEIGTRTNDDGIGTGTSYNWRFGADGNLTFPDISVQNSAYSGNTNSTAGVGSVSGADVTIWTAKSPTITAANLVGRASVNYGAYIEVFNVNVVKDPANNFNCIVTGQIGSTTGFSATLITSGIDVDGNLYINAHDPGGNDANYTISLLQQFN